VLIVDDDDLARDLVRAALDGEGHDIVEAEEGTGALRRLAASDIDLVILDLVMPGLSGQEVLEALRARWSAVELPVIMATARDASVDIVRALNSGANDYVVKPFDGEVLLARVRSQMRVKRLADLRARFTELASHDLRGLLTILRGGAAALKFAVPPGQPMTTTAYELLCNVHDNAAQLQSLVDEFLQVPGIADAPAFLARPFSIHDIARQVVDIYRPYASQKDVAVHLGLGARDPVVSGDPRLIRQVLQNLIDNAVKFGPRGTSVRVETAEDGPRVWAVVSDDGPGIPPADMVDLFVRGKPLSNRPTGGEQSTHIGLPLCKYSLGLHGSELEVENNAERGVRFRFALPRAAR
jgi:signal transduction histidine kinase